MVKYLILIFSYYQHFPDNSKSKTCTFAGISIASHNKVLQPHSVESKVKQLDRTQLLRGKFETKDPWKTVCTSLLLR